MRERKLYKAKRDTSKEHESEVQEKVLNEYFKPPVNPLKS